MYICTKYNIDDHVFIIQGDIVYKLIVTNIEMVAKDKDMDRMVIKYTLSSNTLDYNFIIEEEYVFKSMNDVINYLEKNLKDYTVDE